jgi:predicted molibdopterin-dependent oxidoreductase YjgC
MTESAERPWVLTFDGRSVPAAPGESVGAALTNAGIRSWRLTRKLGRPRGLFCGIGVCFDCLLSVDGLPNQRACLTPVAPGMKVDSGSLTQQELTDE